MVSLSSGADKEVFIGSADDDFISEWGVRASVSGNEGDDTVYAGGYFSTVHGDGGDDDLHVFRSYVDIYGDDGDDYLIVNAANTWDVNIANVSLTGGNGADVFSFTPADRNIYSALITDFNVEDGDMLRLINIDASDYYVYEDEDGETQTYVDWDAFKVYYDRDVRNRNLIFSDATGQINFTLKDKVYVSELADANIYFSLTDIGEDPGRLSVSRTLRISADALMPGLTRYKNDYAVLSSDFVGDFSLSTLNQIVSNVITKIDAVEDTVSGRMISGDRYANAIYAGDYGNKLWGSRGWDTLIGGEGNDTFYAGADDYVTTIYLCGAEDRVVLWDINPDELTVGEWTLTEWSEINGGEFIDLQDGSIRIFRKPNAETTTLQLADGTILRYDHAAVAWQTLEADNAGQSLLPTVENDADSTTGLIKFNGTAYVLTDYEGDFSLVNLNDSEITDISASNDNVRGRILLGDENDNHIYAGDYGNLIRSGGGNDSFYGGDGDDTFYAGTSEGNIDILDCSDDDLVVLSDISFEEVQNDTADIMGGRTGILIEKDDDVVASIYKEASASTTTVMLSDGYYFQWNYFEETMDLWKKIDGFDGLRKYDATVVVTPVYSETVALADLNDSEIVNINAEDDTISGRILIGDGQDNWIFASDYGNSIWGGYGEDSLVGGNGIDIFRAGINEGKSIIFRCDQDDIVDLANIGSDDIDDGTVDLLGLPSGIAVRTEGENIVEILPENSSSTTTIRLSDKSRYVYNYAEDSWEFREAIAGLATDYRTVYISSDFEGEVILGDLIDQLNERSITDIDARSDTMSNRILIGDDNNNAIYANDNGSWLWGGFGGYDKLYGGDGADIYYVGDGEGNTYIDNCEDHDLVVLWNINLSDIANESITSGEYWNNIRLTTNSGNRISIWSDADSVSTTTIQYADGSKRQYHHSSGEWQSI